MHPTGMHSCYFSHLSEILHEMIKKWTDVGKRVHNVHPLLGSANGIFCKFHELKIIQSVQE